MTNDSNDATYATPLAALNKSYTAEELLLFVVQNGSIDLDGVEKEMRKTRKERILADHPYELYQGSDGRWRTYVKDNQKKNGRRLLVKKNLEDLKEALYEYYTNHSDEEIKKRATLESLLDDWLDYKSRDVAVTTIERVKRDWQRYYADEYIVKKPIRDITKLDLDIWIHDMIRKFQMTKHQYVNFKLIIKQELDYAVDRGIIESNPYYKVKINEKRMLVKEPIKDDAEEVFTAEERDMLKELAWDDYENEAYPVHNLVPLAVMFMFLTGLRISEVCAVKYCDVKEKTLVVRRFWRYATGEMVEDTKGTYGIRKVPLIPEALALIDEARRKQQEKGCPDDNLIFSTTGEPILYTSVSKAFIKYCKKIDTTLKSSHKARKTFATRLKEAGFSDNYLRRCLGHVDFSTSNWKYIFDSATEDEKYERVARALQ